MTIISLILIFTGLFLIELLYFKIAKAYHIIDKPNLRSSHSTITIRGGGVIFLFAIIIFFCSHNFQYPFFSIGLLLISLISFLDDILTLNSKIRLIIHFIAVALLFYELHLFSLPWYLLLAAVIFVIGTINAYNFMDGINGITGTYSIVIMATYYYINEYVVPFTPRELLLIVGLALLVFSFFNFRKVAKCFAGDVGSVSIAFIILFLLLQLIIKTGNFSYIMLILLYGMDVVTTIIFRLIRKENVLDAHRAHFYQYWANERKVSHLVISLIYALIQLMINITLILFAPQSIFTVCILVLFSTVMFIIIRFSTEGTKKLLGR